MYTCNNCMTEFNIRLDGSLLIEHSRKPAAALCPNCTADVAVLKVVLRRGADGQFHFDSYQPVEATKRAFGK